MSSDFLRGAFATSTLVDAALGAFFLVAYAVRRRDAAYALFSGVCLSMAGVTAVHSALYTDSRSPALFLLYLLSGLASLGVSMNLHFVMHFVGFPRARLATRTTYGAWALLQISGMVFPVWVAEGAEMTEQALFGARFGQLAIQPGAGAWLFVAFVALSWIASVVLLAQAWSQGMRSALAPLLGCLLLLLTLANDLVLTLAPGTGVAFVSHAFVIYALLVAVALLLRYRDTAKALEQAVARLELQSSELQASHFELRSAQTELAQKRQLAAVGELAAAIAHEVRNPLTVIVNAAAGLKRATLGEADRLTLLRIVEEETMRLNRLVTDLVHYSRPLVLRRTLVPVADLGLQAREFGEGRCRVAMAPGRDPSISTLWVDQDLFRRVLESLLENACQAMPHGGVATLSFARAEHQGKPAVQVTVTDDGEGMDVDTLSRATAPFFSTRPSGVGLGLSIAQRIVEAHGGVLSLESEPKRGTTVTLLLPCEDSSEERQRSAAGIGP